jgi:hypothetical protein
MQKKNLLLLCASMIVTASALYAAQEAVVTQPAGGPEVVNIGCTTPPSPIITRVVRKRRTTPKPPAPKQQKAQVKAEQAEPAAEPKPAKEKPASYARAVAPKSPETADDADTKIAADQAAQALAAEGEKGALASLEGAENPEGAEGVAQKSDGRRVWKTWALSTQESRVRYATTHADIDAYAAEWLKSQNGRHEVGRQLDSATQELAAAGLTPDTASLVKLMTILNKGHELGVSINLADLQNAHAKIKKVKGEVTSNLNSKLAQALAQFMARINQEFAAETKLIALLATTQHQAAHMRSALNDEVGNDSDDE